jgi:HD-GYP domain-containing protein (c-di-GMP phosphodiesterase class II)
VSEEIPLEARIFAIADVWDALRSDRPYRKALPSNTALNYIEDNRGSHFDPEVVDAFLIVYTKFLAGPSET